jgi:4-hydroxybenzoate polyprenyltransferase
MLANALRFIRFSHTIFALPFALGAMLVAANGLPTTRIFILILLAMVSARTAAMVFNRLADWEIDKRNPRTAARHTLLPKSAAITLLLLSTAAFVTTTYCINFLCFILSPVALALIFGYSLTKRFTHYTQLFLGLALSASPVGAWLAVTGQWAWTPVILAGAVLLWVAGFDLIYATQDAEFDRQAGLRSMVVKFGIPRALIIAKSLHLVAFLALALFGYASGLGTIYWWALALIAIVLGYEHRSASRLDIAGINTAFFWSNAVVGFLFVLAIAWETLRSVRVL